MIKNSSANDIIWTQTGRQWVRDIPRTDDETRDTRNHRDVGGAEREHTSRDDNSSKGHPGTPAVLHDGSLPDTPLKAQDLKAEGTRASTLCRREATSQSLPHPSGRFYPSVFHVRSLLHTLRVFPLAAPLYMRYSSLSQVWREVSHCTVSGAERNREPVFTSTPTGNSWIRRPDALLYLLKIRGAARIRLRGRNVPYTLGDRFNLRFVHDSVPRRTFERKMMDANIFVQSWRAFNDFLKFEMNVKYGIYERKNIV